MDCEACTFADTVPTATHNDDHLSRVSIPNPNAIISRAIQMDDSFLYSVIEEASIAALQNCGVFLENGIVPIDTMVNCRHKEEMHSSSSQK
jgi:hypothetical protein